MNAKQENRLSMAKAVLQTLNNNDTVVNSLPALAAAKSQLSAVVNEIDSLSQTQSQKVTAKEKTEAEEAAITLAMEVIAAAKAYALDQNKTAIAASFNYSKRELEKLRDTVLASTLRLLKDNANLLVADLAAYGADAAKLTELQTATDAYEALLSQPKTNMATRSTATKAMSTAFANLADIMEKIDNMIETKRNSHIDFYNTYKSVRKVGDKKGKGVDDKAPIPPVN